MLKKTHFILVLLVFAVIPKTGLAIEDQQALAFVGQDLHLSAQEVESYQLSTAEHTLVFNGGFSMSIGANQFFSDNAVVWLQSVRVEFQGREQIDYNVQVYLEVNVSAEKSEGAEATNLIEMTFDAGNAVAVLFDVRGEVFATADERKSGDPRGLPLYKRALSAVSTAQRSLKVMPKLREPELTEEPMLPTKQLEEKQVIEPGAAWPKRKGPQIRYPVNFAPAGEVGPKIERTPAKTADGMDISTVIGRFYIWQKQDEKGGLLELQADNAVIFSTGSQLEDDEETSGSSDNGNALGKRAVKGVYLSGDVVMTEGQRTVRADELYYDFENKKALAVNATIRSFDVSRGIPIYVRAAKLRQIAANQFSAKDITLTTSEFYKPQISLNASSVIITDTTTIDAQIGKLSDRSYDAEMRDVRMNLGDTTFFYWPYLRGDLQRPDIPLKSMHVGHDNMWGTSLETQWHLSRLLGLREPEGTEGTLSQDYYGKRGFGSGVEVDYERENYFGRLLGYIIHDTGEDRLGRHRMRKDIEPPRKLRGRFSWRHRQFLPYKWQFTMGLNYLSDEHFMESYYRREFATGLERETYVHFKRIEDNWGLSLLAKGRLSDFSDELEELPGVEFHLAGESLFDDRFTLYSDTQISRFRQRIGNEHTTMIDENIFSFVGHRTELDMPLRSGNFKVVPFVAGTFGYDDRSGYTRSLVDSTNTGAFGEDKVWIGELGVRTGTQYSKVYPEVRSRLWDLNKLRHIIEPELTAVLYNESDSVVEQHDVLNFGVSQRLQTIRGPDENRRTVDWMRLDIDFTWVDDSVSASDSGPGADRFIWNKPIVPLRVLSAPDIFNGDLMAGFRRFEMYGPRRNYFGADYLWRLSDTTALLSDMYYDMQSSVVQQYNIGISRMRWPNLSYYIGSRYLRRAQILNEKGSNAFTFAASYVLDPRYTVVFSQQFDFDYGANVRSDITLMRRYHRIYCSLTFSVDESLDRQAIVFSIWPQGVPELGIGNRRYMGVGY